MGVRVGIRVFLFSCANMRLALPPPICGTMPALALPLTPVAVPSQADDTDVVLACPLSTAATCDWRKSDAVLHTTLS